MTWILVAARSGARLFEHSRSGGLRRLDSIPGPTNEERDLADPAATAMDFELLRFTLELAEVLETAAASGASALILMAESRMLGAIRRHLSADTARLIHASVNEARTEWDEDTLARRLAPLLTRDPIPENRC